MNLEYDRNFWAAYTAEDMYLDIKEFSFCFWAAYTAEDF